MKTRKKTNKHTRALRAGAKVREIKREKKKIWMRKKKGKKRRKKERKIANPNRNVIYPWSLPSTHKVQII